MNPVTSCPAAEAFDRLLRGDFPFAEVELLARHVEECERCAATVQPLQAEDMLVEALRSGVKAREQPEKDVVGALANRLKELRSLAVSLPTEEGAATAAPGGAEAVSADEISVSGLLSPPQGPGEIGRLGSYRVLKVLGHGGMGVVLQAEDMRLGRLVALKAMLPQNATRHGMKERFLREARAAAAVEDDHIIPIYQVDEDRGVPYIAMPFLQGTSLEDWLRKRQTGPHGTPLTAAQVLKLGGEIARGLAAAHARGLIHRDIKPANLWLDAASGGRVRILDFGLARLTQSAGEQHLTQSGVVLGRPAYMAPEQARGEKVDARADLFSLGAVLYRLCTGMMPFRGTDTMSTLLAVIMDDPPAPHTVNPSVPRPLSDLVMKLLAKDPAQRPGSADEVVAALQALGLPAPAPKAMPGPAPSRRFPRWRSLVVAGAAAVLVGLLAGFVLLWPTAKGTVRIEVNDPAARVTFDKDGPTITGADRMPITLEAGAHGIVVTRGDFTFETDKLVLKRGAAVTLKVTFLEGKLQIAEDGKLLAEKDLPLAKEFTNRLGMEFVLVPRGRSWLGGGKDRPGDREVEIRHDFYLGKYEVTQEELQKVMGENPSAFSRGEDRQNKDAVKDVPDADLKRFPVEWVSWGYSRVFCERLNQAARETGWRYRLPREVEWEYACRGGPMADKSASAFDYYFEKGTNLLLPEQANFNPGQPTGPRKVGSYRPNALGLYDMHGNVREWCEDKLDPKDAREDALRMHRGGDWHRPADACRAVDREGMPPWKMDNRLGLRVARVPAGK